MQQLIATNKRPGAGNLIGNGTGKLAPFEGGDRREGGGLAAYLAVALGELAGQMKGVAEANAGEPLTPTQDVRNTLQAIRKGQLDQRPCNRVLNYMELAQPAGLEFKAVAAHAGGTAHADLDDARGQFGNVEIWARPIVINTGGHRLGPLLLRLKDLGVCRLKELQPRLRDAIRLPLTHSLRLDAADPSNLHSAAEGFDD